MGGNTFSADSPTYNHKQSSGANPPYWAAVWPLPLTPFRRLWNIFPEDAWNDTTADLAAGGGLSASGGGASIFFAKTDLADRDGVVPADGQTRRPGSFDRCLTQS